MTVLNEEPGTDAGLSLAPNYEPEMSEAKWELSELGQNSELKSKLEVKSTNVEWPEKL